MSNFSPKIDPYIKIEFWHKTRLISKASTSAKKNTWNPVFNETVSFDLPELGNEGLKNIKLNFTVLDEDIGNDDKIGNVIIGGEHNEGTALIHWNKVRGSPNQEYKMWHPFCKTEELHETKDTKPSPSVEYVRSLIDTFFT